MMHGGCLKWSKKNGKLSSLCFGVFFANTVVLYYLFIYSLEECAADSEVRKREQVTEERGQRMGVEGGCAVPRGAWTVVELLLGCLH